MIIKQNELIEKEVEVPLFVDVNEDYIRVLYWQNNPVNDKLSTWKYINLDIISPFKILKNICQVLLLYQVLFTYYLAVLRPRDISLMI